MIELPTRNALNAVALAGFDFVVLDMEHSALDFSTLEAAIAASNAVGLATLVRPWTTAQGVIGKILDCGANGIMAPHVHSAEGARDIVAQARFSPKGSRGFSPISRFDSLSAPLHQLAESVMVVVQIEGQEGLRQVESIAAVAGIDAVFIGPYDLALSLQVPPGSPEVFAAAGRIADCVAAGVHLGLYIDDPAACGQWARRRFALQCVSFDGRMFADAARAVASQARDSLRSDRSISSNNNIQESR
ncbi:MAG TPA: aldolase/citrate lyase family protein [Steroidobacter sp.]